jgi:hypothetical protein
MFNAANQSYVNSVNAALVQPQRGHVGVLA